MVARLALGRALHSGDPVLAESAADRFEACGAFLYAAEAASIEQRLAAESRLHRRATAAAARAQRLARHGDGAHTPALAPPGVQSDLSAREREVALLAADGLTSRQIAERLFVSARTVDNHLQRIYLKLGISDRGALLERLDAARNN
jgi:DNA-binding NarL/FixJ family response regulator